MIASLRLSLLLLWTAYCFFAESLLERFVAQPKHGQLVERWKMRWVRGARRILGLSIVSLPTETMFSTRARLIVANHRSPFDVIAVMCAFSGHFLANHRTSKAGVVGRAAIKIGTIFVDRENRASGANSVRTMRNLLREGKTVIVFPEGTTHGGDEVRTFHQGAFVAARGLDVDVIPVGIAYPPGVEFTEPQLGKYLRRVLGGRVRLAIAVGETEAVPDKDSVEALRVRTQDLVAVARTLL